MPQGWEANCRSGITLAMHHRLIHLGAQSEQFLNGTSAHNRLFSDMKQKSQLVTYAAGPVKSMVDYIIVQQEDSKGS